MFESLLIFGTLSTVQFFHTLDMVKYHAIGDNIFFGLLRREIVTTSSLRQNKEKLPCASEPSGTASRLL